MSTQVKQPLHETAGGLQAKAPRGVIATMADKFGMDPRAFESTIKATVMPVGNRVPSNEEIAAFLLVAKKYDLNPFTKEIFAFPAKGGGIQPIVSIDGWLRIINSHPEFDGMEFEDSIDDAGNLTAVTCRIHRKDRTHPTEVTEYMAECRGNSEPWKRWPARMLRHKSAIQCGRYAFGFSGIMDPDEAERYAVSVEAEQTVTGGARSRRLADVIQPRQNAQAAPQEAEAASPENDSSPDAEPEDLDTTEHTPQSLHDAIVSAKDRPELDALRQHIKLMPEEHRDVLEQLHADRAMELAGL